MPRVPREGKGSKEEPIKAFTIIVKCPRCDFVFLDTLLDPIVCPVCEYEIPVNDYVELPA